MVCLGGSNTFGPEVRGDRTYPAFLERALNAKAPGRFEVWNAGVIAYVLRQKAALAEGMVADFAPDVLVFQHLNVGRRAFLRGQDPGPAFRKAPELWAENLRCLPGAGRPWSQALLARSALWRAVVVALNHSSAVPANNPRFNSEEPNERRFQEFRRRHPELPVFLMPNGAPQTRQGPVAHDPAPALRLLSREALPEVPFREYLFIHPPACVYEWHAETMARQLAAALPGLMRREYGPRPRAGTCRQERRDVLPGTAPARILADPLENARAERLLEDWTRQVPDDAGLWAAAAEAAAAARRPEKARAALARALALRPSAEVLWAASEVYKALGDHPEARRVLAGLAARPGAKPLYAISLAAADLACGRPREAREALARVRKPGPADLARMASVLLALGDDERGLELLERAGPGFWEEPDQALACAAWASRRGRTGLARLCLARAEALQPDAADLARIARAYLACGEAPAALRTAGDLAGLEPGRAGPWVLLAQAQLRGGLREDARRSLRRAESRERSVEDLLAAAPLYEELGEHGRAVEILGSVAGAAAEGPEPALACAEAELRAGRGPAALRCLAPLDAATPQARTFAEAARLYQRLGAPDRAWRLLDRLTAAAPRDAAAWLARAEAGLRGGRPDLAREALARARACGPDPAARHRMALAFQELGDCPSALALLDGLIKDTPGEARYWKDAAVCRYLSGDKARAVRDLQRALDLSPSLLSAAASLGAIHEREGRAREALAVYDRALRAPADPAQAEMRAKLESSRDALARRR